MYDNNDPTQELSVAQRGDNPEHDDGCPVCGGPIEAIERRAPSEVSVSPCGHDITNVQAYALAAPERSTAADREYATDGGQTLDTEHETLMGVELRDLNAAFDALESYYSGHTDGHVTLAERGRCVLVVSQNRRFKHFQTFQSEPALRISNVEALTTQEDGGATEANEPRLKVEIKAADGVSE